MAKHIFNVSDVFDVVEVGEHEFTINMSDQKIREFRGMIYQYGSEFTELSKINTDDLEEEEAEQLEQKARDLLKTVIDGILDAGAYEKIHKELGGSTYNVAGFTEYLFGLIESKYGETKVKKSQDYLKKVKQK